MTIPLPHVFSRFTKSTIIPGKCDILFQSADEKLPLIILTRYDDQSPANHEEPATNSSTEKPQPSQSPPQVTPTSKFHLAPISLKEYEKPPYHPVPGQIDLISALGQAFPHVVSKILDYLKPVDLCSLCCTSRTCRRLVLRDPGSGKKRKQHLKELKALRDEVGQENWPIKKCTPEVKTEIREALGDVKNTQNIQAQQNRVENQMVQEENSHQSVRVGESTQDTVVEKKKPKRRRIVFTDNNQVSSSASKENDSPCLAGKENLDSECGKIDEVKGKGNSKCRKVDASAGSKASKRHLRRL